MSKIFTLALLIFFTCSVSIAEAKGGGRGGGGRSSRSVSRSAPSKPPKATAKPPERSRDSSGKFVPKAGSAGKRPDDKKEDPAPGASGSGMAQTVIGSMVGAAVGTVVGNSISDVIRGGDENESCITHEDKLTDEEKEVM